MTTTRPTTKRSSTDELDGIERILDRLDELFIYRWPHISGPLAVAGLAFGLAWGANVYNLAWLLTVVAGVVFLVGMGNVPELPGRRERRYATFCWVGGTSWVILAGWLGPAAGPVLGPAIGSWRAPLMLLAWLLLLSVAWPPWFRHRRVRRGVEVSTKILAWDGDAVGLAGVELSHSSGKADEDGWRARMKITPKGRYTLAHLRQAIPRIAARFNVASSDVEIIPVHDGKEGEYELQIRERPAPASSVYECPEARPSLREPFRIGRLNQSGGQLLAELWRKGHGGVDGLTAGQKGGGKTGYFKQLALRTIAAHDGELFLADMKPGSPDYQSIGGRGAYVYALKQPEVDLIVRALRVLCEVRGRTKRPNRKVITFLLDESSLYFRPTEIDPGADLETRKAARYADQQRLANWENLMAVSRSADMAIRVATQQGKETRLGGMRSHLLSGEVVGTFSPKASDSALLSGDNEFNLATLPRGVPGEVLLANTIHPDVVRGRLDHVTDAVEREVLKRFAADQGDLDEDELAALEERLGEEWAQLRKANRRRPLSSVPNPPATPEPAVDGAASPVEPGPADVEEEPVRRHTAEESRDVVWAALAACTKPALVRDVAKLCDKGEDTVRIRLKELVAEKRAVQHGTGRWVKFDAVHPELDPDDKPAAAATPNGRKATITAR